MSRTVIQVEGLSKYYRLGAIGSGTLSEDFNRWTQNLFGRSNNQQIDQGQLTGREQGEIWALNNVNFSVKQGEILGIIGRNGAGKSTLLKILSRITAPTSGSIKINGRVGSLLEVGTGFHPELTGRENVYLNGAILGMSKKEVSQKMEEIVEFAEMSQFIDTPVKRYSSGMTVRLAFSVAAHLEPEILIVDEVLAVGDAEFQNKCIGKMENVADHGRTILFVSHSMNVIRNLCTRGILIDEGSVAFDGDIHDATALYMGGSNKTLSLSDSNFHGSMVGKVSFSQIRINGYSISDLSPISPSEPIFFELEGLANEAINDAEIFVSLFSEGFELSNLFDSETTCKLCQGKFVSRFEIPAYLLRPGKYSFKIGSQSPRLKEWQLSDFIGSFDIAPEWSDKIQERKRGPLNILNPGQNRIIPSINEEN
jgi:lipopolysaccharide transport system ATP-binding protein